MKVINLKSDIRVVVAKVISGDRSAQKYLYERYAPRLLSICRQYIPKLDEAEDVLITAFMKIFNNLGRLENLDQVEAWMKRIAINESISFLRSKKNMRFENIEDYDWSRVDHEIEGKLMASDIQSLIDNLPEGCKVVFNLYAVEGFKHQEISNILSISEGTSKSQLAYARKLLQEMVAKQQKINTHG